MSNCHLEEIESILPQTQCQQCGYPDCHGYAQAIYNKEAPINFCPPGGKKGIIKLAKKLNLEPLELDPSKGEEKPLSYALIEEKHCIGCTLCIQSCPVDAILGANKFMHTVDPDLCTGCKLCIPVCPVDCINMTLANKTWTPADALDARIRYEQRKKRLNKEEKQTQSALSQYEQQLIEKNQSNAQTVDPKKQAIAQALARARAKRRKS